DQSPRFSPDGKRIVFSSSRSGLLPHIFIRSSIGIGGDAPLIPEAGNNSGEAAEEWVDGFIVYVRQDAANQTRLDIWLKPDSGNSPAKPYLQSKTFVYGEARVSPNGRWLAYTTNESGKYQIVVQTFPDPNLGKKQVSIEGGLYPTWRRDGRELYYLAP